MISNAINAKRAKMNVNALSSRKHAFSR